jgi:hypothetical protein
MVLAQPNGSSVLALADRTTRMARRARVDRRGSVGCVLRNVRRHVEVAQIVDELAHIVSFIGAELRRRAPGECAQSSWPLRVPWFPLPMRQILFQRPG